MAQILKRTKKSCLKFLRKLTSNLKSSTTKPEEESIRSFPEKSRIDSDEYASDHSVWPYSIGSKVTTNQYQNKTRSQIRNDNSSQLKSNKSTSFIVCSNYTNKLDTYISTARQTINPNLWSCNLRSVRSFRLLTEEDVSNLQNDFSAHRNSGEIIFKKVKYRENIRYFRRTPSNTSLSSHPSTPTAVPKIKEINCGMNEKKTESSCKCNSTYTQTRHSNIYLQFRNNISHPVNLTLTSNATSNLNNLTISEGQNWLNEPYPIVTWDINGNSIDDDITSLNNNWDECDNRLNALRDKSLTKSRLDDSFKSSSKSSSTTLETWVDDEIFDNSVNEQIERQIQQVI